MQYLHLLKNRTFVAAKFLFSISISPEVKNFFTHLLYENEFVAFYNVLGNSRYFALSLWPHF